MKVKASEGSRKENKLYLEFWGFILRESVMYQFEKPAKIFVGGKNSVLSSTRFEFVSAPSGENIKFCLSDHIWQGNLLHYLWPFLKKIFS